MYNIYMHNMKFPGDVTLLNRTNVIQSAEKTLSNSGDKVFQCLNNRVSCQQIIRFSTKILYFFYYTKALLPN